VAGAPASESAIEQGREALVRSRWDAAEDWFRRALAERETASAYEGLSWAAWYRDDAAAAIAARGAAYRLYRGAGDRRGAARMAIWAAVDYLEFRGAIAVAGGWLARAERLLDGLEPVPEHGWLHLHRGAIALELEGDVDAARTYADDAVGIGKEVGDPDVELIGLALRGLAQVAAGEVSEGMPLLDEAAAAALSGEFRAPVSAGWARCYVIYGCEFVRDHDRAAQWCEETAELAERLGLRYLFRVCRTHLAGVMVGYGAWAEAERELAEAIGQLSRTRPGQAVEGLVRLGELRRRQGRLDEAVELFEQADEHPLAAVGLAAVAFDRGDAETALQIAGGCLDALSPRMRALRALPLELIVCARAQLRDSEGARSALADLRALAEQLGTSQLSAACAYCGAAVAVADADYQNAREGFQRAAELYTAGRSPYEAALARQALARVLARVGDEERANAEAAAATRALDSLRSGPAKRDGDGEVLTRREREVLRLVADGLSDDQIAERLVLSQHTIHRHVANIRTKLRVNSRAAAVAKAGRQGLL
jgi:LuxR family transcriptional regulator, maltose regulon positive regulatory protein